MEMKKQKAVTVKKDVIPNLIWNLQRTSFPTQLSNNLRGRSPITILGDDTLCHNGLRAPHTLYPALQACGMTALLNLPPLPVFGHPTRQGARKKEAQRSVYVAQGREITAHGFTLIELLVVVLIMGILAAVALPQYQKAVFKSRLAGPVLWAQNAEKALHLYVLEHGYTCSQGTGTSADCDFDIDINAGLTCTDTQYCSDDTFSYDIVVNADNYNWKVALRKDLVDTYFSCYYSDDGTQTCSCSDDDGYTQEGTWMCELLPQLFPRKWN